MKLNQILNKLFYSAQRGLKCNSASILSYIAVAGVVGTGVTTTMATIEAIEKLKKAQGEKSEELSKKQVLLIAAPCYISPVLIAGSTITCILGANVINKKQQAALMSAYALADRSFKEYRKTLVGLHGEAADKEVKDAIIGKFANYHQIGVDEPDEKLTFYEPFTKTFIRMYEKELIDAEYHFNRNFTMRGYATLNEWLEFLGIPGTDYGEELAWSLCDGYTWVDFEHRLVDTATQESDVFYEINYVFDPNPEWKADWGW